METTEHWPVWPLYQLSYHLHRKYMDVSKFMCKPPVPSPPPSTHHSSKYVSARYSSTGHLQTWSIKFTNDCFKAQSSSASPIFKNHDEGTPCLQPVWIPPLAKSSIHLQLHPQAPLTLPTQDASQDAFCFNIANTSI